MGRKEKKKNKIAVWDLLVRVGVCVFLEFFDVLPP